MKKSVAMIGMLIFLGLLFGGIFGYKYFVNLKIKEAEKANSIKIFTVSATSAKTSLWKPKINIVGSTRTVKGVNVTTQLAGMITEIDFKPGADVKKGEVLVKLNIAPDIAKLHQLEADAKIAKITYHRDLKQFKVGGVSKEKVDQDEANFESTAAQVEEQKATIDKKIIRAPFSGRLGVSEVNPGQYLNPGDRIVTLQTIKPIYIDFYVPQDEIPRLKSGEIAQIKLSSRTDKIFDAPITTINPIVDKEVRNILVEATYQNKGEALLPGMFAYVTVKTGEPKPYITLPQMAVTFNPYGSLVYLLKPTDETVDGKKVYRVKQQFVKTGDTRGNQVAILRGIEVGDQVVTSGQLKIKNDSLVVINNSIQPPDNPSSNFTTN